MNLSLSEIEIGLPGLTSISGKHLYEACVVCLSRQKHSWSGTKILVYNEHEKFEYQLSWNDVFSEQLDRTWKDQFYATEHGAVCLSILLALKLTTYTIVEKSARKNGFDYWLGDKNDPLFQKKARLEISGIFNGSVAQINKRFEVKVKQTNLSDGLKIPAFIGIVDFFNPIAIFGKK